jgi:hypothetical protein
VRRYRSIRSRLEREVERLHSIVDRASKQPVILHPDPRRLWAAADLLQRRELVRLIVARAEVLPARPGARFEPSRVRLEIPLIGVVSRSAAGDGVKDRHASRTRKGTSPPRL